MGRKIRQIGVWNKELQKVVWYDEDGIPLEGVAPAVWDDTIPPTESMATAEGKVFDSKSALMRHYKEHGYECTGGDHITGRGIQDYRHKSSKEEIKADILEAKRKLQWGEVPMTELEKEVCRREERAYRQYRKNR